MIEVRGVEVWHKLPRRDWFLESEHRTEAAAVLRAAELQEAIDTPGNVACLLLKKGLYAVFHTAMMQKGFAGRNATAKGFRTAKTVFTRPAGPADALYYLTTARSRWTLYDSKKQILADETLFAPEWADEVRKALEL